MNFDDGFDSSFIKKEREKARALRNSRWWKNLCSSNPECYYCHKKLKPSEITMDHIVPISQGGKSVKGNVVICCKECNNKKKDSSLLDSILEDINKDTDK